MTKFTIFTETCNDPITTEIIGVRPIQNQENKMVVYHNDKTLLNTMEYLFAGIKVVGLKGRNPRKDSKFFFVLNTNNLGIHAIKIKPQQKAEHLIIASKNWCKKNGSNCNTLIEATLEKSK